MKLKLIPGLSLFLLLGALSSCEKEDPEVTYTATYPVSGEWWVTYKVETSPGVFEDVEHVGYTPLLTYNTAANTASQIWVDDRGNFKNYKVRSGLDMSKLSFAVNEAVNTALDEDAKPVDGNVTIQDGKVFIGSGLSRSKVKTDSIYFRVEFSDDPGTTYHVSGHRRTGFPEDDYKD
ncbi:lipid-binding putative hydrolase [Pontibacter ummariensis]|uniref:Lipid-binding putative hydrolase n=1 Tax=Pontibacter ummariensis TaxID=1610492 RepID=A0A239IWI6_9BACT|nr:lipid-binding protein [Pontibacter ummariensis]PRY08994.1 lipid-binding putative hydrolase [Pontibacter ummariensis]SNS97895.1 Lipid-binding putative hydrolase [Pontibacter ummariensis]